MFAIKVVIFGLDCTGTECQNITQNTNLVLINPSQREHFVTHAYTLDKFKNLKINNDQTTVVPNFSCQLSTKKNSLTRQYKRMVYTKD